MSSKQQCLSHVVVTPEPIPITNLKQDLKIVVSCGPKKICLYFILHTSSYMADLVHFVTVSLSGLLWCLQQLKSEYHLLCAASHQRLRGQTGFHSEFLLISYVSQIRHKREKEAASEENGIRDMLVKRTDTIHVEVTTLKQSQNQSYFCEYNEY